MTDNRCKCGGLRHKCDIERINKLEAERADGWISVEDALPEVRHEVSDWVTIAGIGGVGPGYLVGDKWVAPFIDDIHVTHWRPLPPPPEAP